MSSGNKKLLFWILWLLIVISGPITVIRNSSLSVVFSNPVYIINFFQRIFGLLAFLLIFIQITLGVFINRWVQIIGAKAYKIHITQGLIAYGFIFIHPLFESAITYQLSKNLTDALLVFAPRFESQRDIYLAFGRTGLVLATVSVIAAYFRTKVIFRRNWRAFHILNYLVFYLIFIHMRLGTDISTAPFSWVSWTALVVVSLCLGYRALIPIYLKFRIEKDSKKVLQKA